MSKRFNNGDACVVYNDNERIEELVDTIKSAIYCELRQKFEVNEVGDIFEMIDKAVAMWEAEN